MAPLPAITVRGSLSYKTWQPVRTHFPLVAPSFRIMSTAHSYRPISSSTLSSLGVDLTPSTSPKPKPPRTPAKPTLAQRWESFIRVRQEYSLSQVRPSFFAPAVPPANTTSSQRNAKPSAGPSVPSAQGQRDMAMTTEARKLVKGKSKARRGD